MVVSGGTLLFPPSQYRCVAIGLISADIINSDSRSRYSRRLDGQETFFIKKMFPS